MEQKERVTKDDLKSTREWLSANQEKIPAHILRVLLIVLALVEKLEPLSRRSKNLLHLLLQSWDLEATSEKSQRASSIDTKGKQVKKGRNEADFAKKPRKKKRRAKILKESQFPTSSSLVATINAEQQSVAMESEFTEEERLNPSHFASKWSIKETFDLKFSWNITQTNIETVTHLPTGKKASGGAPKNVPEGGKFTFGTMLNIAILHVGYQMPLTRIARWISNSSVTVYKSTMFGFLTYIAEAFLPIFYLLCESLFKNTKVIEQDDFNTRINKKDCKIESIRAKEHASNAEKILMQLEDEIGLSANQAIDQTKPKTKANLTVFSGLPNENRPNERIVIKLTHKGGAGDLCGRLLVKYRDPQLPLWLVSDLASTNTPRHKGIDRYTIRQQGCIWHARRRFWRVRAYDDECFRALRCFKALAEIETRIDESENPTAEAQRLRQTYSRKLFKILLRVCDLLIKKWGKSSAPGEAAEYVLSNEHTLRQFLKHPFLVPHNNRVERYGRPEKLMISASKFRDTFSGRVVYDVISTIIATCCASNIDFYAYGLAILQNRAAVRSDPENWTPFAWSQRQQSIQK